jgi:hypothetical protein
VLWRSPPGRRFPAAFLKPRSRLFRVLRMPLPHILARATGQQTVLARPTLLPIDGRSTADFGSQRVHRACDQCATAVGLAVGGAERLPDHRLPQRQAVRQESRRDRANPGPIGTQRPRNTPRTADQAKLTGLEAVGEAVPSGTIARKDN